MAWFKRVYVLIAARRSPKSHGVDWTLNMCEDHADLTLTSGNAFSLAIRNMLRQVQRGDGQGMKANTLRENILYPILLRQLYCL